MSRRWLAALLFAVSVAACGGRQAVDPASYTEAAQAAFAEAERAFDRRDYELARSRFTEVYNTYPYSQYAAIAEFRIGDTHLRERAYARAIESYRRFVRIYPSNRLVPEAQYKIALAYVQQMPGDWFMRPPSHERDLSETESAHRALQLFLSNYGDSEFAEEARGHQARTTERLAAYELYVAEFYARRKNPRAAALRCEQLLNAYPESRHAPAALSLYASSMIRLGDVDAAVTALRRLIEEHPAHTLAEQASSWIAQHGEPSGP